MGLLLREPSTGAFASASASTAWAQNWLRTGLFEGVGDRRGQRQTTPTQIPLSMVRRMQQHDGIEAVQGQAVGSARGVCVYVCSTWGCDGCLACRHKVVGEGEGESEDDNT